MADGQRLVELARETIEHLENEEARNESALDRLTRESQQQQAGDEADGKYIYYMHY